MRTMLLRYFRPLAFGAVCALLEVQAAPASQNPDCPLHLQFVELQAVGKVHRSAEYIASIRTSHPSRGATYTVNLTATYNEADLSDAAITAPSLAFPSGYATIVFVVQHPGIQSVKIDSVQDPSGYRTTCSDSDSFTLMGELAGADGFFDDTTINASTGPFVGPVKGLIMTKIVEPDYPEVAKERNIEGEADIVLTVHADGTMSDFSVYKSSGSGLLDDAGMASAKAEAISPARLPPQLGGTLIDVKYLIDYTWELDD